MNGERKRLAEAGEARLWKRWGPYLSERQWGTVREDYSPHGTAWDYLTHDMARRRAYRWGEEGLAGISDDHQLLCFAVALWNGRDPILKERLFGLAHDEGNHGEDVKELYYYLDSTPTHSYMKMLYKYPQAAFPYGRLVEENRRRSFDEPEFELLDTGVFDADRYFDVFTEYAKAAPEDLLIRVTVHNRGPEGAALHLLPQLWLRNTWAWDYADAERRIRCREPRLRAGGRGVIEVGEIDSDLGLARPGLTGPERRGPYWLACEPAAGADGPELLFCGNETRFDGAPGFFKDGIDAYVVHGRGEAVNRAGAGTKAAAHYRLEIPPGGSTTVRLRLSDRRPDEPFADFDAIFARRRAEADVFYAELQSGVTGEDARRVHRQALAGMMWTKQFFHYDVERWLDGDPLQPPPPPGRREGRNHGWRHLKNADVVSMPDKWEYPWYAAWDLAFHCLPLALVDAGFAKEQLELLTRERYMHPNGQIPAYEWAFDHVNPPVHAWATLRVFQIDREERRRATGDAFHPGDLDFLERVYRKLVLNFDWWLEHESTDVPHLFRGGFLGLDNVGVFDRGAPLPGGAHLHQADGSGWMAMYALNLMRIALELARRRPGTGYQEDAAAYCERFLRVARAMTRGDGDAIGLWHEDDGYFYDVLHRADGREEPLRTRSIVGLVPLFAVEVLDDGLVEPLSGFTGRLQSLLEKEPDLAGFEERGAGRRLLAVLRGRRLRRVLRRLLDEAELLSDHGVRTLSRDHAEHPYRLELDGHVHAIGYQPAETQDDAFGSNSNWRGPVWFPMSYLVVESLETLHAFYGDDFTIECPTGSGRAVTLRGAARELRRRLIGTFLRNEDGRRPVFGRREKLQTDPRFRDHLLFYEYFHGDDGRGVGASHQTGWTGLVANLLQPPGRRDP